MPKILFVEDDPFISEIYTKKFTSSGFEVIPALTGKDALKKAHEGTFDLIMLDMVIPELSGMEVLRELRSNKSFDPNLKVVIFSNLSGPQERQEATSAGANGFISKTDFTPSQVVAEVQRYLDQFASQAKNAERNPVSGAVPAAVENEGSVMGAKKILLIEDEPVFVEMFSKALLDAGYAVTTEHNGQNGLNRVQNEHFDLVITDHLLPSVSGKEIIEILRNDERFVSLPIFLLTASLEEEEVKALQDSGAVNRSFLKTQVTPTELAMVVNDFFNGR
ncbi:MAG: response regulator [Undibacterium sp.]